MASKRILIPYFLAGAGHLVAAQAVAYYLKEKRPEWDIRLLEPAVEWNEPSLQWVYKDFWKLVLERQAFGRFVFGFGKVLPSVTSLIHWLEIRDGVEEAVGFLAGWRPDCIITTHWGGGHLFRRAEQILGSSIPLFYVDTDFSSPSSLYNCGADCTFYMFERTREDLLGWRVLEEKLLKVNLLVRPSFTGELDQSRARETVGIPQDAFTVLFALGGEGLGPTAGFVSAFTDSVRNGRLLLVTGKNQRLCSELAERYTDERIVVFPYREDMNVLMAASDAVMGKCGPNFTMEAAVMRKPFIVTWVGAPHERSGMENIVERGYGWYAPTPEQLCNLLKELTERPSLLAQVRERFEQIPRKGGGEEIADFVIGRIG